MMTLDEAIRRAERHRGREIRHRCGSTRYIVEKVVLCHEPHVNVQRADDLSWRTHIPLHNYTRHYVLCFPEKEERPMDYDAKDLQSAPAEVLEEALRLRRKMDEERASAEAERQALEERREELRTVAVSCLQGKAESGDVAAAEILLKLTAEE